MSGLQQMTSDLRKDFSSLSSQISVLKRKTPQEKREGLRTLRNQLKRLANSVSMFELQIDDQSTMIDVDSFRSQLSQYKNSLKKYENELNFINNDQTSTEALFQGATGVTVQKRAQSGQKKAVIQLGRQGQQKMFNALNVIDRDLTDMQQIATNVNIQLQRQLQALDRIYNTVNDTDSALNRAKKHIRYFARQIYTDKIMMCLIVLIVIAIIVTVIMSIVGVGKGSFFSKT